MVFNGAEEYKSYKGLEAGYYGLITDEEAQYVLENPLFPKLEMSVRCAECFYTGYLLGKEIRRDHERDKACQLKSN